jgi:putative alpha-1,2-mannosidase
VIDVKNNGDENVYVQSAMLNGQPLEDSWFYRQDLINGGSLKLEMGPEPNKEWGD